MTVPWSPIPGESTEKAEQLVGLIVKFGLSILTWIDRIRIGTPPMMLGTRVGDGRDLRGQRIDVERDPDDHDAVVVGAGEGRRDRREAERRALEGADEVHLPDRVERVAAGAGGDVGGPDLARTAGSSGSPARRDPRFWAAARIAASGQ